MDAEQAEVRVLEAEVQALKRALEELPAPAAATARVRYVVLLRPRGRAERVLSGCAPPAAVPGTERGRDAECRRGRSGSRGGGGEGGRPPGSAAPGAGALCAAEGAFPGAAWRTDRVPVLPSRVIRFGP